LRLVKSQREVSQETKNIPSLKLTARP